MSTYVTRPSIPSLEEFIEEIRPIWESKMLTNMGPLYKMFCEQLKEYMEVSNISVFSSGHISLEMAIEALGIKKPEGEVITTPFTFISTTHAIVRSGLKPVFCDIKERDCTIDPDGIEQLINENTVAILPVHVYGNICDVEKIDRIAKKNNLKVIYDAAHAFGIKYKGLNVANYGDAAVFSFHATKVFNTFEGGAVAYNDAKYSNKLNVLKNFGIISEDEINIVGGNGKMDELRAAIGICNLRHIDDYITNRKTAYDMYIELLNKIDGITILNHDSRNERNETSSQNYGYLPIRINRDIFGASRDDVYGALYKNDIKVRKYFYPLTNLARCYVDDFGKAHTPVAKKISEEVLTLPLYDTIDKKTICKVCEIIQETKKVILGN